jgi:biopolymer transport protein ExbB/TolQ
MLFTVEIIGIIAMCTLTFILIWGFIIAKQTLSQIRYKNYLLEQIKEHLHSISEKCNTLSPSENTCNNFEDKNKKTI